MSLFDYYRNEYLHELSVNGNNVDDNDDFNVDDPSDNDTDENTDNQENEEGTPSDATANDAEAVDDTDTAGTEDQGSDDTGEDNEDNFTHGIALDYVFGHARTDRQADGCYLFLMEWQYEKSR